MTEQLFCAHCGSRQKTGAVCTACGNDPVLAERYSLLRVIGQGAAGTTYEASDSQTGERVAVKEIPLQRLNAKQLERLEREAKVLRELRHARIPNYVEHFKRGVGKQSSFYIIQGFVDGSTLDAEFTERRYRERDVLKIMAEVLEILVYLHDLRPPVIHRDIKPKNLIREQACGEIFLIDFGAVKDAVTDPSVGGSTIVGTYGYMAPEQFKGIATPQTDLFSVGVVAAVLLSRKTAQELTDAMHNFVWEDAVGASDGLRSLLTGLLAPAIDDRITSAAEALRVVQALRDGRENISFETVAGERIGDPESSSESQAVDDSVAKLVVPKLSVTKDLRKKVGARSKWTALLLSALTGFVGGQYWYTRQYAKGVLSLLFASTALPFLFSIIWAFRHVFMAQEEFDRLYNPMLIELQQPHSLVEQLIALHSLVEEGALTPEEFEAAKRQVLGDSTPAIAQRVTMNSLPELTRVIQKSMNLAGSVGSDVLRELAIELQRQRRRR